MKAEETTYKTKKDRLMETSRSFYTKESDFLIYHGKGGWNFIVSVLYIPFLTCCLLLASHVQMTEVLSQA